MSSSKYKNFLSLLAKESNLLVFDDGVLLKEHKELFDVFAFYRYSNVNEETLASLSQMLLTLKCDLALIYVKNHEQVLHISQAVKQFDQTIALVVILEETLSPLSKDIANMADAVLVAGFEEKDLYRKLSGALNMKLMEYKLSHTLSTQKNFAEDGDVNLYIQNYKDDAVMVLERLLALRERLVSGELGHEFFCEIADEMDVVGTLFSQHRYTKHIKTIFDEMSAFLRIYDFEQVDVATLVGFDYLGAILGDVHNYVESFFIDKIFSDVYVFEASLRDTILFMIRRLTNRDDVKERDREDDVEFF